MNCPNCKARNPIGNKFCRECGQKLPLEENTLAAEEAQQVEAERARERAAKLLTEAFSLSQHGKPAEALPLAQEAAQLLPESTSALTLCATLYERLGQNGEAIAAMEKVVALNPDSAVDADKLDRLRRGVHLMPRRPTVTEPEPTEERSWLPVAIGVGAGVLALSVGLGVLVRINQQKSNVPVARLNLSPTPLPATPAPQARIASTPGGSLGPLSPPTMPAGRPDPFQPTGQVPLAGNPTPAPFVAGPRAGRPGGALLPNPNEAPAATNPGVPPLTFPNLPNGGRPGQGLPPLGGVQRSTDPIQAGPPQGGSGGGNIPAGPPTTSAEPPTNPPASETTNPGYIRIREHSGGGGGGSERAFADTELDPLLKAQTLQTAGKYRDAIPAYREALSRGAAVGEVQQGIALCHQRLGEKASARAAYQSAIVAFEAQVRAGKGVEQASRGLAACRAALSVLGH